MYAYGINGQALKKEVYSLKMASALQWRYQPAMFRKLLAAPNNFCISSMQIYLLKDPADAFETHNTAGSDSLSCLVSSLTSSSFLLHIDLDHGANVRYLTGGSVCNCFRLSFRFWDYFV